MEQDLNAILSEQLRGLQAPETIGLWPPAFGWWLLAVLIIGFFVFVIYKIRASRRANVYKRQALAELKKIHDRWQQDQKIESYLQSTNALLKRALLSSEMNTKNSNGNREKAIETTSNWAYTLRTASKKPLNEDAVYALTTALYQANPSVDVKNIRKAARSWLVGHSQKQSTQTTSLQTDLSTTGDANA